MRYKLLYYCNKYMYFVQQRVNYYINILCYILHCYNIIYYAYVVL